MVINIITYMLFVGLVGVFKTSVSFDRIFSWIMLFILTFVGYGYFFANYQDLTSPFSFLWGSSQLGDIFVDFLPSVNINQQLFPIYFISLLSILNNCIFRYEERKCFYNALIVFNLMAVSLLVCAQNYLQLLTMVFVSDILGFIILRNIDSSHRYILYNFVADMLLFMILALACGKIQSLEMSRLLGYEQIGKHKDFVGLVMAFALCIKMGCFLFQNYLTDLGATRFQRMTTVNLLFSPLIGLLLLLKIHNLLQVSEFFIPCFKVMIFLSFITGIVGFIVNKYLNKKTVYLNMCFIALLLYIFVQNNFIWNRDISVCYIVIYLINHLYFKIYLYQNRESDVSKMLNCRDINPIALKTIFIQMCLILGFFMMIIYDIATSMNNYCIFSLGVIFYLSNAIVMNHLYVLPFSHRLDYLNQNTLRILSFAINSLLIFYGFYLFNNHVQIICFNVCCFIICVSLPICSFFRKYYDNPMLQKNELSKNFLFFILIAPLTYISRRFWLMVDVFLSEKIIARAFSIFNFVSISLFLTINRPKWQTYLLSLLAGFLIFIITYKWSVMP